MIGIKIEGRIHTDADAYAEGGDDFLDEVERVRGDDGVGHGAAVVERDHVALGQRLPQLTQHLLVPIFSEPHHLNVK